MNIGKNDAFIVPQTRVSIRTVNAKSGKVSRTTRELTERQKPSSSGFG